MNPRAWASVFAFCAALGLALLVAQLPRPDAPEPLAICRALAPPPGTALPCLDGLAPDILSAELAGSAKRWHCLVQRGTPETAPGLDLRECAEHRTQRLRDEVRGFDQGLFIPLYSGLSALLVAWAWSHARLCAAPRPGRVRAIAVALGGATLLLVGLDLWENSRLLALLDLLDRAGAAHWAAMSAAVDADALDASARAARRVSSIKWLASASWALCLGLALQAVLRWLPPRQAPRVWRWWCIGTYALALLAAALMGVGGLAGLASQGLRLPVQALGAGTVALVTALAGAGLAAAWGAIKRGIPFAASLPVVQPPP